MDIVRYKGGLGNQMFQYALVEALRSRGRDVFSSLGFYRKNKDTRPFCLNHVFDNIYLNEIDDVIFDEIDNQWKKIKTCEERLEHFKKDIVNRFFWVEEKEGEYEEKIYQTKGCTFVGYWQSYLYFSNIRDIIIERFQFKQGESNLVRLQEQVRNSRDYVSVHIRRGDYLYAQDMYGNICTKEYYDAAMRYIQERRANIKFMFFSDDIEWVKKNYYDKSAIYVDKSMFQTYDFWYDMSLMSACASNIIANSSFSWWGAWLNQRDDNIVVAPSKWLNGSEMKDICPPEWIRL